MDNQAKEVLGAQDLIAYLLKEQKIRQEVSLGLKPQARNYQGCKIVPEEERIYFGKYSWNGFGGFMNNLIKCYDHITFDDFYIKTWDALMKMCSNNPTVQEAIREGLSREVLLQGIHAKDQNILHRFFDVCRHLTDEGYWRDQGTKHENVSHHIKGCPYSGGVTIEAEPQKRRNVAFDVVDSIGDVFETITARWRGGRC